VHAIRTVDEAIALLTGVEAGEQDEHDAYPPETVNYRVDARLKELFELRRQLGSDEIRKKPPEPTENGNPDEV
jgi:hypothetical protein